MRGEGQRDAGCRGEDFGVRDEGGDEDGILGEGAPGEAAPRDGVGTSATSVTRVSFIVELVLIFAIISRTSC